MNFKQLFSISISYLLYGKRNGIENDEYDSSDDSFEDLCAKTQVQAFEQAWRQSDWDHAEKTLYWLATDNPYLLVYDALVKAKEEGRDDLIITILISNQNLPTYNASFSWRKEVAANIVKNEDLAMLDYILNVKDRENDTSPNFYPLAELVLTEAAKSGKERMVEQLIQQGVSVRTDKTNNIYPLNAAAGGGNKNITSLLLENGADINEMDEMRFTPIICAIKSGDLEMVEFLLSKGLEAFMIVKDDGLDNAALHGHVAVVKALLRLGKTICYFKK